MEKFEQEKYGNSKGKTRQKVDHFWEYYKMHVIGGIIGIIVIVMIVQAVINHRQQANLPPPDLEIMAFGNFPVADAEALETQMLEAFPEWQRVKVTVTSVDFTSENGPDYAMLQRAIVLLATERPHLYILDEGSFAWLLPQQVYEPLESLTKTDPQRFVIGNMKPNSDEDISKLDPQLLEDRAYGVNTTDSALWETLRSPNTEKIVTFSSHHGLNEQAQQFLQYLLTNKGK